MKIDIKIFLMIFVMKLIPLFLSTTFFVSTVWSRRSFEKNIIVSKLDLLSLSEKLNSAVSSKAKARSKFQPRGEDQELYVRHLNDPVVKIVAGVGAAGTGKTLFACDEAIQQLFQGNINKIILTRPLITVEDENIGFLPGNMNSKMNPWLLPIYDTFREYLTQKEIDKKVAEGIIEICPLGYMRGRTFKDCFVIADEMQNATPSQVLMLMTRLGKNCKLAITGDLVQSDLNCINGLYDFVNKFNMFEHRFDSPDEIKIVEFKHAQIERSTVVKKVLEIFSEHSDYDVHGGFFR